MPRVISTYRLWLRGKPQTEVKAFGATPVPEEDRIYFHKKDDLSDRDIANSFLLSQIVGIDLELSEAPEPSLEQYKQYLEEARARARLQNGQPGTGVSPHYRQ